VAEIYAKPHVLITKVCYNGTDVIFDFTCKADNEVCKSERKLSMKDFVSAINESLVKLELQFNLKIQEK